MNTPMQNSVGDFSIHLLEGMYCWIRKCIFKILCIGPVPNHIAFIMDGNRRYAKKMNLGEGEGHKAGFSALLSILRYCFELGVKYVSVYAFSIDNFKRKPKDVEALMEMMRHKIEELLQQESIINEYSVRLRFIGKLQLLSEPVRLSCEKAMSLTAHNSHRVLVICVAYTSTDEILHSVHQTCREKWHDVAKVFKHNGGEMTASKRVIETNEEINKYYKEVHSNSIELVDIERNMYMSVAPDPDILIRTSGEARLSNFLLWQTTTCPLYAPKALWPEMGLMDLIIGVLTFQKYHHYLDKKNKKKKKKHA